MASIRGWTSHHRFLCDMLLTTGVYVYGELGCRNVRMKRTACVSDGASECSFLIEWD